MRIAAIISLHNDKSQKLANSQVFRELAGKPLISHCIERIRTITGMELILVIGLPNIPIDLSNETRIEFIQEDITQIRSDIIEDYDAILMINGFFPLLSKETIELLLESGLYKKFVYIDDMELDLRKEEWNLSKIVLVSGPFPIEERYSLETIYDFISRYKLHVDNGEIISVKPKDKWEIREVVDNKTWSLTYTKMREIINRKHMLNGVTITEPTTTYIDIDVVIGLDTTIYPGTIISGLTRIGDNCIIDPKAIIRNSNIESDCIIRSAVVENCHISYKSVVDSNIYLDGQFITPN